MVENQTGQPDQAEPRRYDALAAAEHIPEMVNRIVAVFDPAKIILFGSHARGDAHRWSDIDLLVVFDEPVDVHRHAADIRFMLRDVVVAKDIVVTDEEHLVEHGHKIGTVFRPALREGRVLYERT